MSDEAAVGVRFLRRPRTLGPIGILVTSAAIAGFTRFDKITLDEWNRYLAVNLTGTFLAVREALSDMVEATGAGSSPSPQPPASKVRLGRGTMRPPRVA